MVGAGMKDLAATAKPMQEAIPDNAEWIKDGVAAFDPDHNKVTTEGGREVGSSSDRCQSLTIVLFI